MPVTKKTRANGRKPPFAKRAEEYQTLKERIELSPEELADWFQHAPRTERRYKSGNGEVPQPVLILLRLLSTGLITKKQVMRASSTPEA